MKFIHPAPNARLTSPFGYRTLSGTKEFHYGIDLAQTGNVPILAAADGTVTNIWGEKASTYGNVIFLDHVIDGKRMDTVYAHLKSFAVKKGDKVKQGQIIGYMGNTGRSTGQHLHFEVHNGAWKTGRPNAVDPILYIDVADSTDKELILPATVEKWNVYPTDKAPVKANAIGALNPKKFGGLTYDIIANPQKDVYTIKTQNYGKVNIYAASSTGATIKEKAQPTPTPQPQSTQKTLVLPATVSSWNVYPLGKSPIKANAIGALNPKKFGGLTYEILGNPQNDVYTIKTANFGTVNIYAAKSTGAKIQ